jgi:hypothetical protein
VTRIKNTILLPCGVHPLEARHVVVQVVEDGCALPENSVACEERPLGREKKRDGINGVPGTV